MFDNNIENFLKPIEPNSTCGIDMSASDKFLEVRDLRIELQQNEVNQTKDEWSYKKKAATYQTLADMCENILKSVSKDLIVNTFYIEALFKTDSLYGISHGLKVFHALCEQYWSELYPMLDQDFLELRAKPFKLLQGCLFKSASSYIIAEDSENKISLYQFFDESNSVKLSQLTQKTEQCLIKLKTETLAKNVEIIENILESLDKICEYANVLNDDEIDILSCEKVLKKALKLYQTAYDKLTEIKETDNQNSSNTPALTIETVKDDPALNIIKQINGESQEISTLAKTAANSFPLQVQQLNFQTSADAYLAIEKAVTYLLTQDPQALIPNLIQKQLNYRSQSIADVLYELNEISAGKHSLIKFFE